MFTSFNKNHFVALLTLLSVSTINFSVMADDCCYPSNYNQCPCNPCDCNPCDCGKFYIGAFGGELFSSKAELRQTGTAFFSEDFGGPLAVDARGHSREHTLAYGGVQVGYDLCPIRLGCSDWTITPAAEVEAYFYRDKKKGHLINFLSNSLARLDEHDFFDHFHVDVGVYVINGVFSFNSCWLGNFYPYLGGGIGAAHLSARKAKSFQVSPPEEGVNHFNAKTNDSTWTFAAQGKAGLLYNFCERFGVFVEYRFLYLDTSKFNFGSTDYLTHVPTSTWDVDVRHNWYNAFAVGLQFYL